jgi:hypothetical protein
MTKDEILMLARKHDPDACWASDAADENCLLIAKEATVFILDRDVPGAYEDPNLPGTVADHTRIVFPQLEI